MLTFSLSCEVCGGPLSGRQTAVCSNACRQARKRMRKLTATEHEALLWGRDCAYPGCLEVFDPRTPKQRYCSENCSAAHKREIEDARWDAVCELDGCDENTGWDGVGAPRRFCSNAHKQKAYRLRKAVESASDGR
jgi:predicted nucleic acid-binding Zn ribbon protein